MIGKEKRQLQQEMDEATTKRDLDQQALRELVQEATVKELSNECWEQISSSSSTSFAVHFLVGPILQDNSDARH